MQRSGVCSLGATLSVAVFSSWVGAATAETLHFRFNEAEIGADSDPTGLFSNDEVAEGGASGSATPLPSILYTTFPVDGGEVTLSILQNGWCSASECPYRFRLTTDTGMVLLSHYGDAYGMICQAPELMSYDREALILTACGSEIDLKDAR